jgi:hypothetical protein
VQAFQHEPQGLNMRLNGWQRFGIAASVIGQ